MIVLGIDSGGTSTRAAILDDQGNILGKGTAGSANYDDNGIEAAQANIQRAVDEARHAAGLSPMTFDGVWLGMAGVVSPHDHEVVHSMADRLGLAHRVGVSHDIRVALAGGLSGRPGIALITGTGSSCYGLNTERKQWRSGGWGDLLADEGSGYWLGVEAMKAATRAYDGRGQQTQLTDMVIEQLQITDLNEIMYRLYVQKLSRSETAALAPFVIEAAQQKDGVALELIQRGAGELAACVIAVARYLEMEAAEVALVGGIYEAGELVIQPLREAVTRTLPHCTLKRAELSPVIGAAILALQMLGVWLNEAQLKNLQQLQPGS